MHSGFIHVCSQGECVAKLGEGWLARKNRIVAKGFLNQCCGLVAILESILLARTPKIVLQHIRVLSGHFASAFRGPGLTQTGLSATSAFAPALYPNAPDTQRCDSC